MAFLTKEESRVSLIGTVAALAGSLIGGCLTLVGTRMTFTENRKVQTEANRRQAYTQLMGQKAELLMLIQQLTDAHDKGTFYQGRAAQLTVAANEEGKGSNQRRPVTQMKGISDRDSYLAEAIQEERNADRYNDEAVTCVQKMFESIGLVQLSFPASQELDGKINAAAAMLTRTDDVFPKESLFERMLWVMKTADAEQQLSQRQKERMVYIRKAVQPLTDLLDYLQAQLLTA